MSSLIKLAIWYKKLIFLQYLIWIVYHQRASCQEVFHIEDYHTDAIQHVTVNEINGDVYIGATNNIFRLNSDLKFLGNVTTGPLLYNPKCTLFGTCENRNLTDCVNKLLIINYQSNVLITCGSADYGLCDLRNLNDLARLKRPYIQVAADDPNASTYGFIGPGPDNDIVLYVAVTQQHESLLKVPAMSTRRLTFLNFNKEELQIYDKTRTEFNYDDANYLIDYIYGFADDGFSYFLSLQKGVTIQGTVASIQNRYETRLVRICATDISYTSYVESPIVCKGSNDIDYNLLQAAYKLNPGSQLAQMLHLTINQHIFLGVFAQSSSLTSNIPSSRSAVCIFTLENANRVLNEAIMDCFGGGIPRGMPWDNQGSQQCIKNEKAKNEVYNCSRDFLGNPRIGGNKAITATAIREYPNELLTAITALSAESNTIAIIGTKNGKILRLSINSNTAATQYSEEQVVIQEKINSLTLAKSFGRCYAATQKSVHKLSVAKCNQYSTCDQCVLSQDPLCGWCILDNKCSRKSVCSNASYWLKRGDTSRCISITNINPSVVSVEDKSNITIKLLNLNSLPILSYACSYETIPVQFPARLLPGSSDTLQCSTPRYASLSIAAVNHYVQVPVSIIIFLTNSAKHVVVATKEVKFFNCSSYQSSCNACTTSPFGCVWCFYDHTCKSGPSSCATVSVGENSVWKNSACPRIYATKINVPLNSKRGIIIAGNSLKPEKNLLQYRCHLHIEGIHYQIPATYINSSAIQCQPRNYTTKSIVSAFNSSLAVSIGNGKLIDSSGRLTVVFYNCESRRSECGLCLAFRYEEGLECGWCRTTNPHCSVRDACKSNDWLSNRCQNPTINAIVPMFGPVEGGTPITIMGSNLGSHISDISKITVGGINCKSLKNSYQSSRQITCITERSGTVASAQIHLDVYGTTISSRSVFSYVNPVIKQIVPKRGPRSGGSMLSIIGSYLNVGNYIKVTVAGRLCKLTQRNFSQIECMTSSLPITTTPSTNQTRRHAPLLHGLVIVYYDNSTSRKSNQSFVYTHDPIFKSLSPPRTIQSGGLPIKITGTNLNSVMRPKLFIMLWLPDGNFTVEGDKICDNTIPTGATMYCRTPDVSKYVNSTVLSSHEVQANIGLVMDGVLEMKELYNSHKLQSTLFIASDPIIYKFDNDPYVHEGKLLAINGSHLNDVATESDYEVFVGDEICRVHAISESEILCLLSEAHFDDNTQDYPSVSVSVGNLKFKVGRIRHENEMLPIIPLLIGSIAGGIVLVAIVIGLIIYHRRKTKVNKNEVKSLRQKYDDMGQSLAAECRRAFAELQTDMCDLATDLDLSGAPEYPIRVYVQKTLFPHVRHNELHPAFVPISVDNNKINQVEGGLSAFLNFLLHERFLITLINTFEKQPDFRMKDRCNVASYLLISLHENMGYVTKLLIKLLTEMIHNLPNKSNPRLLLRRTESIAEKLLSNWLSICLYDYSSKRIGQPLYLLFHAIKQQLNKGPIDQIIGEARYSLSEDRLLREQLEAREISVVASIGNCQQINLKLLDYDTITQAKEKILDAIYVNQAYSSCPKAADFDLEAYRYNGASAYRIIMADNDKTNDVLENGWYRLNTIGHYDIANNTSLKLVTKRRRSVDTTSLSSGCKSLQSSRSFLFAKYSNSSRSVTLGSEVEQQKLQRQQSNSGREKPFHLVKSNDTYTDNDRVLPEAFLMCLLLSKGALQKYTQDLFESLFTLPRDPKTFPPAVKYLFDFLDHQASQMQYSDPTIVRSWKNNSLPLRFYVNLIKNPNFLFDINKTEIIDSSLSVIAQAFMDACSISESKLNKDSPSNRLLYAREIPRYRERVTQFYDAIQRLPALTETQLMKEMETLSSNLNNSFDRSSALYELYIYTCKYLKPFQENLRNANLLHLFDAFEVQVVRLLQGDTRC